MLTIGCHLSSSRGYLAMGKDAVKINANTFQFFTRNPRGSRAKPVDPADVAAYLALAMEVGLGVILAHAPYTIGAGYGGGTGGHSGPRPLYHQPLLQG